MNHRLWILCAATALVVSACDGETGGTDAFVQLPDAGPALPMSELFGPCVEDWQCPGQGAVCRPATEGWPGGYCTVPCEDRTPCEHRGVYHHCATRADATQSYCERRCLNGIDCGRDGYTCAGELPPSGGVCLGVCSTDEQCGGGTVCDRYSGQCVVGEPAGGAITGEACGEAGDCRSGQCVVEVNEAGVPTGWVGGYCTGNCILPPGFNSSEFYSGEALPPGTCPGDAVCLPAEGNSRGDLGTCYDQCTGAGDCRPGYTCLQQIQLQTGVSSYTNGLCVPADCARTPCPGGYQCVTVTSANGPRNVCAPL